MRQVVALCLLVVVVVGLCEGAPQRTRYTSKYDGVDIDRILSNPRILTNYIKCLMEEGPCTVEGRELKKTLPDAIKTDCGGCSESQKTMVDKVIKHLRTSRARDWDRLTKKFDPSGEVKKRFEQRDAEASTKSSAVATTT